eukprot:COSAG01_NODE_134_length_24525_cov_434.185172_15_plen_92_part_00
MHTMKYRATGGCRTPKHKDLGSIAAHDHESMERNVGVRSLYIVGGYSWWCWVSIILVEELDGLIVLDFCQNPERRERLALHRRARGPLIAF